MKRSRGRPKEPGLRFAAQIACDLVKAYQVSDSAAGAAAWDALQKSGDRQYGAPVNVESVTRVMRALRKRGGEPLRYGNMIFVKAASLLSPALKNEGQSEAKALLEAFNRNVAAARNAYAAALAELKTKEK